MFSTNTMTNMLQYFWLWLTMVFGSGFEVEQKFKFSELQRNLGCWRNPEQSHHLPLAISNADTPFILLTRQPEGRGDPEWALFTEEKQVHKSSDSSLLELVTCIEWLALNGSWCDSPGEAQFLHQMVWIAPGVRRKPVTYCHEAINHWQITRATVKDVKPAAAFCTLSDFTISHHWVLSFEMEVRHSIGLLSAVRVGVKQLWQLMNGPVPLSRLMTEAKRSQEFFLILIPNKPWKRSVDRSTLDVLHPHVPISACKMTLPRQSHRFR